MKSIIKKILILSICSVASILFMNNVSLAEEKASSKNESDKSHYLIGANDLLNIFVWKETDLTRDVTVMPDGRITFPLIGEIDAQGQTVTGLRNEIAEKLKNYISSPEVTVIIKESKSRQIYTIGKMNKPGPFQLAPGMTILQALSTAGGFIEWADTKNVLIVRRKNDKEMMYHFNYQEFISGKNLEQNIVLEPNDTIVVP
jgi:polysaccharide biosynthesis/export protein